MKGRNRKGQLRAMWFKKLHDKSNLWLVHNPKLVRQYEGAVIGAGTFGSAVFSVVPLPPNIRLAGQTLALSSIAGGLAIEKAYSKYRNKYEQVLRKTKSSDIADKEVLKLHGRYVI